MQNIKLRSNTWNASTDYLKLSKSNCFCYLKRVGIDLIVCWMTPVSKLDRIA
jgi:hypothetical protein